MSVNRSATITPLLFRTATRSARSQRVQFPSRLQAIAILVPRRAQSTETSTSTAAGTYPPPGFSADPAKKEPQDIERKQQQSADAYDAAGANRQLDKSQGIQAPKSDLAALSTKSDTGESKSLSALATDSAALEKAEDKKLEARKKDEKKLTLWQKVKKEVAHYWDGTKLLVTEVKISSKLALKMAAGYELTRRENRQLQRTVQDLGRLVPFSVFVIVPFAELLLPVALKLFPNLLPSTYEGQKSKDAKATSLRATRKDVSSFLRDTLKETGLPVSAANAKTDEFIEFFRKVRTTGEAPTASEVIKVCKIFKDDLTLDNLSRPQLVGICRYMNLNTFGTDAILRYQVRHRMRQIKRDDRAITSEGVESLSVTEVQSACASRGLRTYGMSPGRLRDDLQVWLDLRLKYGVPSTLLVLSNAFVYAQGKETEFNSQIDALQSVLASVPEELFHEIELEVHTAEGAATNRQRLEVLKEQQELIEEENEQSTSEGSSGNTPKDDQDIDEREEVQLEKKEEAQPEKAEAPAPTSAEKKA